MEGLPKEKIELLRTMRRNGMSVRDIQGKIGVSRQTVHKYTDNLRDNRLGHAYKAPCAPRYTVGSVLPNGTRRSVTADSRERAEMVCSWRSIGDVAAEIMAETAINRLGPAAERSTKVTGREGVGSTDPALTETTFHGGT